MEETSVKPVIIAGIVISVILFAAVIISFATPRKGTIVLPAGGTYLGPSPSPTPISEGSGQAQNQNEVLALRSEATKWKTVKGNIYPYSFEAPETLKLVTFPNDTYDIYAIDCCNSAPSSNVLIGVDDLSKKEELKKYLKLPLRQYVAEWYKQFGGLKGVASIDEFTNAKGLKGYRAKFINQQDATPTVDIFFEVAGKPQYVIHLANGILDPTTFDKIVDSVSWTK